MKRRLGITLTGLLVAALVVFALAACGESSEPEPTSSEFTNDGMTLSVPVEYAELVAVETPDSSKEGRLFQVAEKASIEAAKEQGSEDADDPEGPGWLFSIGRVSEDEMHQMLTGDMSGGQVFAKDGEDNYYIFYHPTDVRLIRMDNEEMEASMDQWSALNEWAAGVPATFVKDNEGLTAETHGNTDLDIYLAKIAYGGEKDYTVSTLEYGPLEPNGVDPLPYIAPLLNGVTYEEADIKDAPDGEYVVLNFPGDEVRFDFFLAEGGENYIRQTWSDNEMLYKAVFADESIKASAVMQKWYDALAKKR